MIEKSCRKCAPKASFRSLFDFAKQPKTAIAHKKLFKTGILKEGYQKALRKLSLFFPSNPLPFNGQIYQKQKVYGTSHQSLFRPWKKFRKIPLIIIYLSDQVWWCNVKLFLSYPKNYICKFMQVISWHHKLYHFHLPFWIWKVWKGRGKITKIWWNKKDFS